MGESRMSEIGLGNHILAENYSCVDMTRSNSQAKGPE